MSPTLFCIYLDNLLNLLAAAKIGCFVGKGFVGCLAYADDIRLYIVCKPEEGGSEGFGVFHLIATAICYLFLAIIYQYSM